MYLMWHLQPQGPFPNLHQVWAVHLHPIAVALWFLVKRLGCTVRESALSQTTGPVRRAVCMVPIRQPWEWTLMHNNTTLATTKTSLCAVCIARRRRNGHTSHLQPTHYIYRNLVFFFYIQIDTQRDTYAETHRYTHRYTPLHTQRHTQQHRTTFILCSLCCFPYVFLPRRPCFSLPISFFFLFSVSRVLVSLSVSLSSLRFFISTYR